MSRFAFILSNLFRGKKKNFLHITSAISHSQRYPVERFWTFGTDNCAGNQTFTASNRGSFADSRIRAVYVDGVLGRDQWTLSFPLPQLQPHKSLSGKQAGWLSRCSALSEEQKVSADASIVWRKPARDVGRGWAPRLRKRGSETGRATRSGSGFLGRRIIADVWKAKWDAVVNIAIRDPGESLWLRPFLFLLTESGHTVKSLHFCRH